MLSPTLSRLSVIGLLLTALLMPEWLAAQTETPRENVQRRQAEQRSQRNPYWEGFQLKHQGNCDAALAKLTPLAKRGFGFEDAQTALGECHLTLAGLPADGGDSPPRDGLRDNENYQAGLSWINKAANAGHFEAQGVLISLYAVGLGPDMDKIEAAKWAHLYLTNPQRLSLGAPVMAANAINELKATMDKTNWVLGKQAARRWVPVYDRTSENTNDQAAADK
jgi:hypothetical protein